MSRARQHHSVSRRQASRSAKRAFGSPARGSARKQAQTGGRLTCAQFGSVFGIVILPNLNYTILPEIIEGITRFLAETNFAVIFYN